MPRLIFAGPKIPRPIFAGPNMSRPIFARQKRPAGGGFFPENCSPPCLIMIFRAESDSGHDSSPHRQKCQKNPKMSMIMVTMMRTMWHDDDYADGHYDDGYGDGDADEDDGDDNDGDEDVA